MLAWMKYGLHLAMANLFDTSRTSTQLLNNWDHKEASLFRSMFHSITGYDTVHCISLFWEGGASAWYVWNVFPQITDTSSILASVPEKIPTQAMTLIERFVVLLYNRTNLNKARQELLSKGNYCFK